jgi:hypothetical protein
MQRTFHVRSNYSLILYHILIGLKVHLAKFVDMEIGYSVERLRSSDLLDWVCIRFSYAFIKNLTMR